MRKKEKPQEPKKEPLKDDQFDNKLNTEAEQKRSICQVLKSNIIEICSIAIAIISLSIAVNQGNKTIQHNKLSVQPKLQFEYFNVPGESFHVSIKNSGVGPAIIEDFKFRSSSNKSFSSKDLQGKFWYSVFEYLEFPTSLWPFISHYIVNTSYFISADEKIEILGIYSDSLNTDNYLKFLKAFSKSSFIVEYHSIYNSSFKDSLSIEIIFKPIQTKTGQ